MLLSSPFLGFVAMFDEPMSQEPERRASVLGDFVPFFVYPTFPYNPTYADWGLSENFSAYVRDWDGDSINVTWEWGDGTFSYNNTAPENKTWPVRQKHVYTPPEPPGQDRMTLKLNVTLDDGFGHTALRVIDVILTLPPPPNAPPTLFKQEVIPKAEFYDPSESVTISAKANDSEGEALTWVFVFNNGTEDYRTVVMHTGITAPDEYVWCNVTHVFLTEGSHKVIVSVSDALDPDYQIFPHNVSVNITVEVLTNRAPVATDMFYSPSSPVIKFPEQTFIVVNYSVGALDEDGDALNVTWDFGDGSPLVYNESAGGTNDLLYFYQPRVYTDAGFKNVTAWITDGRTGHEIRVNVTILVDSTNRPPDIIKFRALFLSGGIYAEVNETVEFELIIFDPEDDRVEVILDWGDGSPVIRFNLTEFVNHNATIYLNHTFIAEGNYTIRLDFTDNKIGLFDHSLNYTLNVQIWLVIEPTVEGWGWWDYTSLALLCMIPVLIAVRFYMMAQHRKRVEAEGFSVEEWKLLKEQQRNGGA